MNDKLEPLFGAKKFFCNHYVAFSLCFGYIVVRFNNNIIDMQHFGLVPILIALQFMAFGWRINREIPRWDKAEGSWLPLADVINIFSILALLNKHSIIWEVKLLYSFSP